MCKLKICRCGVEMISIKPVEIYTHNTPVVLLTLTINVLHVSIPHMFLISSFASWNFVKGNLGVSGLNLSDEKTS